jgi:formate dehydrogenase major subunit
MLKTVELAAREAKPNDHNGAHELILEKTIPVKVDGVIQPASADELLVDVLNRGGIQLPQGCYQPQLGPIQTCDTCMVEIDGELVRACATRVSAGLNVTTNSTAANEAQREAFDRILSNHLLYCTVCDNSNGNCTVHNTTRLLAVEHQNIPFRTKPYSVDMLDQSTV